MSDADVPGVCHVLRACFEWLAAREGFTARQLAFLLGERSSPETVRQEGRTRPTLVACESDRVVGVAVVHGNELSRLYVHPDCHGRGIGRLLFRAAEELIRQAGHGEMRVGAMAESAAGFYRAMGMSEVGRVSWEPDVFGDRAVTILRKSLEG